jgi:hypothetical protein
MGNSGHNRRSCRYFATFAVLPPKYCLRLLGKAGSAGDSPASQGFPAMIRSSRAAGFDGHAAPVASSRLTNAVAASLAIGSLSLCLIVALTVLSIKVSMAMPLPA